MRSSRSRLATTIIVGLFVAAACTSAATPAPVVTPTASPATPSPTTLATPASSVQETWTATEAMIGARREHTATLMLGGNVLMAGGYIIGEVLASAELYDPASGSWAATGDIDVARGDHTTTLLSDGRVLVAGGIGDRGPFSSAELYDPATGFWAATGNIDVARSGHTATLLPDGRVLVAGGTSGIDTSDLLASAELYDPDSGSWTATGSMGRDRYFHTATLLPDGRVLVAGGEGFGGALASAELYDPDSGSWTVTGSLVGGVGRDFVSSNYGTATLLRDGTVLATAGSYFGGPPPSAQLYDPSSGSWIATANMIETRDGYTATLLPDGRVLVAGGAIARCDSTTTAGCIETNAPVSGELASAEVYDPGNRSWTATPNMDEARRYHTATLLPDGNVLVAGGYSPIGEVLASAELYDPGSGS